MLVIEKTRTIDEFVEHPRWDKIVGKIIRRHLGIRLGNRLGNRLGTGVGGGRGLRLRFQFGLRLGLRLENGERIGRWHRNRLQRLRGGISKEV